MKANCRHAYLATCDGLQPRVRPVSPIVEDDMSIWVTTFSDTRKVKQLRENARISLAFVEQPDGEKAATVIGEAQVIEDLGEKRRIWGIAWFDLSQYFPDGPESKDFCLLRILIRSIEWRDSWTGGTKTYLPSQE
ncbi:hypothetical protein AMJ40_04860 [candidate division TA06 bacterium DG_26]|uniref:Pyridoxamine 5'-phosphate oxidase N-terminal domain-containing protein n=1 Tax=candidate division TA06 bacterium DG_26 TaxID=1703771 RepID=A0A0S7WHX5_UNCT6|nr:MAG: hypothetical protein AMJ40_04860 [candidate division TA06 bacterium DG_26]